MLLPAKDSIDNRTVRDGRYLPTLDGWRAIAISLVLLAHGSDSIAAYLQLFHLKIDLKGLHDVGLAGVQIFFGLSGFLITNRLLDEESRRGSISLRSFYTRRAFRILPAAIVFLGVSGALAFFGILPITGDRWLSTLLFFANYSSAKSSWYVGHFWSLAVEEHFYFIWPLAFLLLATFHKRLVTTVAVALLLALWRAVAFKFHLTYTNPATFWGRTDIQVDNIIWGVVIALLYAEPEWHRKIRSLLRFPGATLAIAIFMLIYLVMPLHEWKLNFLLLTAKAALIPLFIVSTIECVNYPLFRLLESAPFRMIGRLSYSIYLWQQLFLVWSPFETYYLRVVQLFPFNIIVTLACAVISMVFIERPLIAFGHKLTKGFNARTHGLATAASP